MTLLLVAVALAAAALVPAAASAEICPDGLTRCVSLETCLRGCLPHTEVRCFRVDPDLGTFCI